VENIARVRKLSCHFVCIVLLNYDIETNCIMPIRLVVEILSKLGSTWKLGSGGLGGREEVVQRVSAYIFTSQGSQGQGIGMDLYNSSPVAREI